MSEEKIVENMSVVSDKLVQYMDAAEKVITQYGGDAVNLGLNVLRIEAVAGVLLWATAFVLCIISLVIFIKRFREDRFTDRDLVVLFASGMVGLISGVVMLEESIIWPIVGLLWPEAYAVHKFLM